MVAVGGGNIRIVRQKDMEHKSGLMETDTSGSTCRVSHTGMQYTDGLMEQYITESTKSASKMVKDIRGGQMAMNIGENGRIT